MSVTDKINKLGNVRWATRGVIMFATGVSVWGNYLSAKPDDWISRGAEVLPPLFLFGVLELMTRVPIRPGNSRWHYKRWLRPLALVAIAGACFRMSYENQYHAFLPHTSNDGAMWLPGIIDATMIIALVTLIELNDQIRELEAVVTAEQLVETKRADPNSVPRKPRSKTKTERIVAVLTKHPEMRDMDVVKHLKGEVSQSLVYATRRSLKNRETVAA